MGGWGEEEDSRHPTSHQHRSSVCHRGNFRDHKTFGEVWHHFPACPRLLFRSSRNPRLPQLQPLSARYNLIKKSPKKNHKKRRISQKAPAVATPGEGAEVHAVNARSTSVVGGRGWVGRGGGHSTGRHARSCVTRELVQHVSHPDQKNQKKSSVPNLGLCTQSSKKTPIPLHCVPFLSESSTLLAAPCSLCECPRWPLVW